MAKKLPATEVSHMRLYIGGLGPSVTSNDMESTFSAFGRVSSVEIVRSKGRNFGYLDFEAASPKDLQRLFSLLNGCMWKGGRIKVEKAREHYLDRLRREWAEDVAQLETTVGLTKDSINTVSDNQPRKGADTERPKPLKIFFPGLKKAKLIAEKGHKEHIRSFDCIESPSKSNLQTSCSYEDNKMETTASCTLISADRRSTGLASMQANQVGDTWVQKASWKTLIGDKGSVFFSLSDMLGLSLSPSQYSSPGISCINGQQSTNNLHPSPSIATANERSLEREPMDLALRRFRKANKETLQTDFQNVTSGHRVEEGTCVTVDVSHSAGNNNKTCTFMRSSNAEQEWLESKRLLKDIVKTRRKEALRSTKKLYNRPLHALGSC